MRSYDERLDTLLGTAARVFAEKGYHPTTMRDLARETGMSLAGMYHYVRGKEQLLYLVQDRCFSAVISGATRAVAEETEPGPRLAAFIKHHVTFFASHMPEMKVLSHEAESLEGEALKRVLALKRRYVALLTELIRAADPEERADPVVAGYALFGMMNWIYTWYDPAGRMSVEALADQFSDLFLHGLTSPSPATSEGGTR